ncbi:MAG: hypothetical protein RI988_1668, partial [Pseudomonadota bacterium]
IVARQMATDAKLKAFVQEFRDLLFG